MPYNTIFSKSFSKREQKKLGCTTLFGCLIVGATFYTFLSAAFLDPLQIWDLQQSVDGILEDLTCSVNKFKPEKSYKETKTGKAICGLTNRRTNICQMEGEIKIHGNSSTIFFTSEDPNETNRTWSMRPYAKTHQAALRRVTNFTIKASSNGIPNCTKTYNIPAVVFATAGYVGNAFHDFADVLIPLFQTAREFDCHVQFLVTNYQRWWIGKYRAFLRKLSKHEVIDIDKENEVLCFPRVTVGLKADKELTIDTSKSPYSMKGFREFIRGVYSLERESLFNIRVSKKGYDVGQVRPRLLIISRQKTRRFLNDQEIARMAESLGFEVVVKEMDWKLQEVAELVNTCDVMVGVHGAGLSNMVFLPEKSVVIQVVGLAMDSIAKYDFEDSALEMGLWYLSYKININESSLSEKYDPNDNILKRPEVAIANKGYKYFDDIYLTNQHVKIDTKRFRETLEKALELLKNKM